MLSQAMKDTSRSRQKYSIHFGSREYVFQTNGTYHRREVGECAQYVFTRLDVVYRRLACAFSSVPPLRDLVQAKVMTSLSSPRSDISSATQQLQPDSVGYVFVRKGSETESPQYSGRRISQMYETMGWKLAWLREWYGAVIRLEEGMGGEGCEGCPGNRNGSASLSAHFSRLHTSRAQLRQQQ
jgi:hypothetical protein